MKKMDHKIIGISGISGAGKTSIVQALAKSLNAESVFWDDFDDISSGPKDYVDWYDRGKNYDEWDYKALANVLDNLKKGSDVEHPIKQMLLKSTSCIVFDAPLGRLHTQTGCHMDFCVHLKVPLDIALARRLIRDFKVPEKSKEELLQELELYLSHSRKLFFDEALIKSADMIIDGMLSTEMQVRTLKQFLTQKSSS